MPVKVREFLFTFKVRYLWQTHVNIEYFLFSMSLAQLYMYITLCVKTRVLYREFVSRKHIILPMLIVYSVNLCLE